MEWMLSESRIGVVCPSWDKFREIMTGIATGRLPNRALELCPDIPRALAARNSGFDHEAQDIATRIHRAKLSLSNDRDTVGLETMGGRLAMLGVQISNVGQNGYLLGLTRYDDSGSSRGMGRWVNDPEDPIAAELGLLRGLILKASCIVPTQGPDHDFEIDFGEINDRAGGQIFDHAMTGEMLASIVMSASYDRRSSLLPLVTRTTADWSIDCNFYGEDDKYHYRKAVGSRFHGMANTRADGKGPCGVGISLTFFGQRRSSIEYVPIVAEAAQVEAKNLADEIVARLNGQPWPTEPTEVKETIETGESA